MNRLLTFLIIFFFAALSFAQDGNPIQEQDSTSLAKGNFPPTPKSPPSILEASSFLSDVEFWNSIVIVFFALFVIIFLARIKSGELSSEQYFRLIVLTLVIFASLYLIAAGWNNQQTAPAFGILGTIAGYLLGKGSNNP